MIRGLKSRYSIAGAALLVLVIVFAGANLIFSKDRPTFKAWQVEAIKACTKMVDQNNAAFAKIFTSEEDLTVANFIAFEKSFEPDFESFETYLKSLDRPAEQGSKVEEFVGAVEGYRKNLQKSSTNLAAAQAEFAAEGRTPASMRFGIAASALGLQKCVS